MLSMVLFIVPFYYALIPSLHSSFDLTHMLDVVCLGLTIDIGKETVASGSPITIPKELYRRGCVESAAAGLKVRMNALCCLIRVLVCALPCTYASLVEDR